jgi:hypothetical protein
VPLVLWVFCVRVTFFLAILTVLCFILFTDPCQVDHSGQLPSTWDGEHRGDFLLLRVVAGEQPPRGDRRIPKQDAQGEGFKNVHVDVKGAENMIWLRPKVAEPKENGKT